MKHLRLPATLVLTSLMAMLLVAAPLVRAQVENLDDITKAAVVLTAIPPRVGDDGSLKAKPGEVVQTLVRVRNSSNSPIKISTLAEDFIIGEDGKTPVPVNEATNSRWSMARWMRITIPESIIASQGSANIPVVIDVPEDALPGGHYAMIMHQPVAESGEITTNQAAVNQRVGTLVYLLVEGDITEDAVVRNVTLPRVSEFGPVPVAFAIENLSDVHIRPAVQIYVKNMFGRTVDTLTVESQNVFPYTLRQFETQWDRVWGLGRYSITIEATYGSQAKIATAHAYFWMLPLRLILAVLVALLTLLGIGVAVRRHWLHRQNIEQQHITLLEDRIRQLEQDLHSQERP